MCIRDSLAEGTPLHGVWVDRTAQYNQPYLTEKDVATHYTLKLHRLPGHENLSEFEYRQLIRHLTNEALEECEPEHPPLGAKRILSTEPHSQPEHSEKSPAPLCHSNCSENRRKFIAAFKSFVEGYKDAFRHALHHAMAKEVPDGGIPPVGWHALVSSG